MGNIYQICDREAHRAGRRLEEKVWEAILLLVEEGVIQSPVRADPRSEMDRAGIDFRFVTARKRYVVQFQLKSSRCGAEKFRLIGVARGAKKIPVFIAQEYESVEAIAQRLKKRFVKDVRGRFSIPRKEV